MPSEAGLNMKNSDNKVFSILDPLIGFKGYWHNEGNSYTLIKSETTSANLVMFPSKTGSDRTLGVTFHLKMIS